MAPPVYVIIQAAKCADEDYIKHQTAVKFLYFGHAVLGFKIFSVVAVGFHNYSFKNYKSKLMKCGLLKKYNFPNRIICGMNCNLIFLVHQFPYFAFLPFFSEEGIVIERFGGVARNANSPSNNREKRPRKT